MITILRTRLTDPDGLTVEVEIRDQIKEDAVNAMQELKADLFGLGYKPLAPAAPGSDPAQPSLPSNLAGEPAPIESPASDPPPPAPHIHLPLTPHGLLLWVNSGLKPEARYSNPKELCKAVGGRWPDFKDHQAVQSAAERGIRARMTGQPIVN
jgi:hypothetical protein